MDDQQPKATPGPYTYANVAGSSDIDIVSAQTGESVARVMSSASGHTNAPDDATAQANLSLLKAAPRLRESLEVVLEREFEPMHPQIASAIRELLAEIDHGDRNGIAHGRKMNEERKQLQKRLFGDRKIEDCRLGVTILRDDEQQENPGFEW